MKYPIGVRGEYWNRNDGATPRSYHDMKSGIFGDVSMQAVPPVSVEDVFVRPDQNHDKVTVEVTVNNQTRLPAPVSITNTIKTWPAGKTALKFTSNPTRILKPGKTTLSVTQTWRDYKLWWPDDPTLYNMVTTLKLGPLQLDQAINRFGVRDVHAVESSDPTKRGVYVNGVRTALFGESIETNTVGQGVDNIAQDGLTFNGNWALTRTYFSHVIDVAKSMNINVLRIHRGWALNKELVEIADEKGMMLIGENPVIIRTWEPLLTDQYRQSGLSMMLQIAKHYRNNPSIVMWSISNENPAYNDDLTAGMKTGYAGQPAVNPDIQLVSTNAETDTVASGGYRGTYLHETTNKTWFDYEENASYIKLTDDARRSSVVDSMRIFRQQRMSLGYDAKIALAFYNFQKVFALPDQAHSKIKIPWTKDQINGPGYHAEYMWNSIFNPYTTPATDNTMPEYTPSSQQLWADSYAPVAVFDKDWVDNAMKSSSLTTSYSAGRTLYLFNSDLKDRTTALTATWTLTNRDTGEALNTGTFTQDVPLGGYVTHDIVTGPAPTKNLDLHLTVTKSGTTRYDETLTFGGTDAEPSPVQTTPGDDTIVMDNDVDGTSSSGLTRTTAYAKTYGKDAAATAAVQADDFARYTPYLGSDGDYQVLVHVPAGLTGTQKVSLTWEDGGLQQADQTIDVSTPGWVEVPGGPRTMTKGQSSTSLTLVAGGTSTVLAADAVAFQRVDTDPTTRHTIDQTRAPASGTTWEYLGRYTCEAGKNCHITLTNDANNRVVADAVQFRQDDTTITLDEDRATTTGTWTHADKPTSQGGDLVYADKATPATATITWTPDLPTSGEWDVYTTWDDDPDNNGSHRATNAPYTVTTTSDEGGTTTPTGPWDVVDDPMDSGAAWTPGGNGGTANWSDGALRLVDSSTAFYKAVTRTGFAAPTGAFTFEFTAHTNDSANAGSSEVGVRSGAYYARVVLNHGATGTVADGYGDATTISTLDTTVDHIYRAVVHADHTFDLYVDGARVWKGAPSKGTGTSVLKIASEPMLLGDVTVGSVRVANGELVP
ncbi:hypothetical protein GCM10025864_13520 [Luteimicrobium album]|uniref:Beta-galactosidase n=1 Tax=Luteimicrobium album TaxID=1054550 RepID=A0ABQ6HYM1_9MICO|nr:glycoside hydrolase family 2 TIM barrel-domain containing protein [Luteimicrobium album]GMA23593.1 hypothetical protein GCM10025864_13520 [Luteimicrobium album]